MHADPDTCYICGRDLAGQLVCHGRAWIAGALYFDVALCVPCSAPLRLDRYIELGPGFEANYIAPVPHHPKKRAKPPQPTTG